MKKELVKECWKKYVFSHFRFNYIFQRYKSFVFFFRLVEKAYEIVFMMQWMPYPGNLRIFKISVCVP